MVTWSSVRTSDSVCVCLVGLEWPPQSVQSAASCRARHTVLSRDPGRHPGACILMQAFLFQCDSSLCIVSGCKASVAAWLLQRNPFKSMTVFFCCCCFLLQSCPVPFTVLERGTGCTFCTAGCPGGENSDLETRNIPGSIPLILHTVMVRCEY